MLLIKSVWLWIHSVLFPSYTYEANSPTSTNGGRLNLHGQNATSEFQVIGAGLSRTGTFSTRIALTSLLGGKCYHGYVGSLDGQIELLITFNDITIMIHLIIRRRA